MSAGKAPRHRSSIYLTSFHIVVVVAGNMEGTNPPPVPFNTFIDLMNQPAARDLVKEINT